MGKLLGKLLGLLVALVLIPVGSMLSIAGIFTTNGFLVLAGSLLVIASMGVIVLLPSTLLVDAFSWLVLRRRGGNNGD